VTFNPARGELWNNARPAVDRAVGMVFYTGDRFPGWKNNLLVRAMLGGSVSRYPHLERIIFNEK